MLNLVGVLNETPHLTGKLNPCPALSGNLHILSFPEEARTYTGPTSVTPMVNSVSTLLTQNKYLKQNITVEKIPQFEISNDAGGYTLIIGEEYYNGD